MEVEKSLAFVVSEQAKTAEKRWKTAFAVAMILLAASWIYFFTS